MRNETEWVLERIKLYQLLQAEPDWSLRQYAQALQHDPKWIRKWVNRIKATAAVTLELFKSQSRTPKTIHHRIGAEAKQLVSDLRQQLSEQFHRKAGAKTIAYGLKQYASAHAPAFSLPKSLTTITQILHETGWIRPRRPVAHEPVALPGPMEEWELDFGEIWLPEGGVFEFFIVVDRGTSRLVYVEASAGYNAETALEAVVRLLVQQGLPQRLRFDRDVRLWGAWTRDSYPSPFIRFLRVLGIEPVVCPPHRPDLKPFVERCIETLKYEWFARRFPLTFAEALEQLEQFPWYYNEERPHQGRACRNQPPSVAFPRLPELPQLPLQVAPDDWLKASHGRVYRRRVNSDGTIQIDRHTYTIGTAYARQPVLAHLDAGQKVFHVTLDGTEVKVLAVQGLYGEPLPFWSYFRLIQAEARTVALHHWALWMQTGDTP